MHTPDVHADATGTDAPTEPEPDRAHRDHTDDHTKEIR